MSIEQSKGPPPNATSHAEHWVKKQGLQPIREPVLPPPETTSLAQEAYDLFIEKQDLQIYKQRHQTTEGSHTKLALPIEQKLRLVSQGDVSDILASLESSTTTDTGPRIDERIRSIEQRLTTVLATPGVYERYQEGFHHQIDIRHQAKEVLKLERLEDRLGLITRKMARAASVESRVLTSVEETVIRENQMLANEARRRREELLTNQDVFDQVRLEELEDYRDQLKKGGYVETPSRIRYITELERLWGQGKKVLVTGATGSGKTELIRHTSQRMFDRYPFSITGHDKMTPWEILGSKGLSQGESVYEPSQLIQAMIASGGRGAPFFYDEMDASPNPANMALKTLLNRKPGDAISVQTDSQQVFTIGHDYSFSATANVKSEKHTTRFEIDPAIVRIFEPIILPYMPPAEVWDIAVSSLIDRRGGLPLTAEDAEKTLKDICDAAFWTQRAYLGEKIVTDEARGSFIEARGAATTGKFASLKEAVLDPGKVVGMLEGWEAARLEGKDLREFLDEQLVRFVNNENFPEEDRYYLVEILALKGFLKGMEASEFQVAGLTQQTLDKWTVSGGKQRTSQKTEKAYLSPDRVARLDPYKRFGLPITEAASELLEGETEEAKQYGAEIERAREILGDDFLGEEAVREMERKLIDMGVNIEFNLSELPEFPYTHEDLEIAKKEGEILVLRPENMTLDGGETSINLLNFRKLFERANDIALSRFATPPNDWYKNEAFAKQRGDIKLQWALVKKSVLKGSTSQTYDDQDGVLRSYATKLQGEGATNTDVKRRSAMEAAWDTYLYYINRNKRLLAVTWDWTSSETSLGERVHVGVFGTERVLSIGRRAPGNASFVIGVCSQR